MTTPACPTTVAYATLLPLMATHPQNPLPEPSSLYCPNCAEEVTDPLTCGDCSSVICRRCGTPLESPDELGIG
jgi:predicted amidophosphoribosyltransferase